MYISIHAAAFIWIFAIFGFAVFLWNILNTFFWLRQSRKGKYSIIISVKDQEETVEGIIRSLVLQSGLEGNEVPFLNVVVVDAGIFRSEPFTGLSESKGSRHKKKPTCIRSAVSIFQLKTFLIDSFKSRW